MRYADDLTRVSGRNFLDGYGGEAPMPLCYLCFVLRGPAGVVMVDTGGDEAVLARLNKRYRGGVAEALAALGVDPRTVETVVQTHLHWDHAGNTALFPRAHFHLQRRELDYVTGPLMRHAVLRAGYEVSEVAAVATLEAQGRLSLYDGDWDGPDGLRIFHLGGHTDGLQALSLPTRRGRLCLAGDAVPFRANLERRVPFPALLSVDEALDGFERVLAEVAGDHASVVPGHDPWVADAHPAAVPGSEGWIIRLD